MEEIEERAKEYCKRVGEENIKSLYGYIEGATEQQAIEERNKLMLEDVFETRMQVQAWDALFAYCKSECDTFRFDCPHKEQGGCTKYKKFKSIFYGTIHNLRTATEQE